MTAAALFARDRRRCHHIKHTAAMIMIPTGIQTPMAIFAPVESPLDSLESELLVGWGAKEVEERES